MSFEVEVKYRVADQMAFAASIRSLGTCVSGRLTHADLYLAHPGRDFRKSDEALRLRRIGDECRITYKGPKRGGPTKTREEIELPLGTGADVFKHWSTLFERLGFLPVALVTKTREEFDVEVAGRHLTVTLDDAGSLGHFAEVEALAEDEADLPQTQAAVLELAGRLGLEDVEPRSYLGMTLEQLGGS